MNHKFSILINTTDSFEDCWFPFFRLFKIYWPEYQGKIYLNTETKTYTHQGLTIISLQNNKNNPNSRFTWSECLRRALTLIEDDIILYMQEDYFLKNYVKNDLVEMFVQLMHENSKIECIHLTDACGNLAETSKYHDNLHHLVSPQRYLTNCQAAIWKKSTLLSIIRSHEKAWQFEEFGSIRAEKLKPIFLGVDRTWVKHDQFEIIPYVFTGIIQGRWYEHVVELFRKHDIVIDFSIRGFVNQAPNRSIQTKIKYRLNRLPVLIKHWFES